MDVILCGVLADDEDHDGDASPGWEGNAHLRMRLRSQRTDQPRHSQGSSTSTELAPKSLKRIFSSSYRKYYGAIPYTSANHATIVKGDSSWRRAILLILHQSCLFFLVGGDIPPWLDVVDRCPSLRLFSSLKAVNRGRCCTSGRRSNPVAMTGCAGA